MLGTKKQKIRGVQHYKIKQYQDLDCLLGQNWHYRGLNSSGDFGYVILNTVDFYIYTAHTLTEYFPSPSFVPQKSTRHMGFFCFIRGVAEINTKKVVTELKLNAYLLSQYWCQPLFY